MKAGSTREASEDGLTGRLPSRVEPSPAPGQNGAAPAEPSHLLQEIESLRTRLSKLSQAGLRVSETLDVNTVLQEVIDNARDLTCEWYGALLTYDQSGGIQDFMTSGLSVEEIEHLRVSPKGVGLLAYMNEIREPLRLADISSHPSSVGVSREPSADEDLSRNAHPLSRRACRQHLPHGEGGRQGFHE